jgi:pyruvate dehydrogenase E1 component
MIPDSVFAEFAEGSDGRDISTTMAFVRILSKLLKDKQVGKLVVPIIPDEARTFGMESLFRQIGIYSHAGQLYEPVDAGTLMYYHEAKDGQLLEEGITEAGSMSSFIAAGCAHATHGINTIPFFVYYSMFGMQRIGDLVWAAADMRSRGFMIGGTAGRTTLNGEGLQHQDGNSHLLAYPVPNLKAYDPAFAFELAAIIKDGIRRMYVEQEDVFYYITVENEPYAMPAQPEGCEEGILRGMYRFRPSGSDAAELKANLFGSGAILNQALRAQEILADRFNVAADVWSITSFKELYMDGTDCDRFNRLHGRDDRRKPWIQQCLADTDGAYVVASDYVKALPESIGKWFPKAPIALGTDGFGRSESRAALRRFFEVDAEHIVVAALSALADEERIDRDVVHNAIDDFGIAADSPNPVKV